MTNGAEKPPEILTQLLSDKTGVCEPDAARILDALFNAHDGILVANLDQARPIRVMGVTVDRVPSSEQPYVADDRRESTA
jgi:hypothetical protein